jgi:hypothetical protein
MTIWRMRILCWIPKATNTISEYVILISFPLQQWLHDSALMLRYTYITYRVYFSHRCLQQRICNTLLKQGLLTHLLKPNCLCMNIFLSSYISFFLIRSIVGRGFEVAWKTHECQNMVYVTYTESSDVSVTS